MLPIGGGKAVMMNENVLARDWNARSLMRFAFPTIVMMIFMGLYTVVDTVFVARFVNTDHNIRRC